MSRNGSHHINAAPARIARYFAENPDEELTVEQAVIKFGVTGRAVTAAVYRAVQRDELEYVHVIRLPAKGRS